MHGVRNVLVSILFVALTLPFLVRFLVVSHYFSNYEYYSEVLCENKDKPELKCNGSCQLSEELKDSSPESNNDPNRTIENLRVEISFFVVDTYEFPNYGCSTELTDKPLEGGQDTYTYLLIEEIFKPPIYTSFL